jgi:two-component system, OmpR family, phosphate regulon sensor histidine kinase PhoR
LLNPAAGRIFGLAAAEALGRPAAEAIAGWPAIAAVPLAAPSEGGKVRVVPVERDGDEQWLAVAAADAGDGVVYTVRDVTDERRLEQLRADIVATVSHELRTPLTGVYGAATTLLGRDDDLPKEARRGLLEVLVEQARRLAGIVDQILLASRLDGAGVDAQLEVVDAADVLRGLGAGSHRVVVDEDGGVRIRADVDRLRQVVDNLVDNALKYSSGPVRVATEARELSGRIVVSDEGPGIPAAERERIFEKFYRLDPDQRSGVSGTGLGLYIARELVDRMGGRIGLLDSAGGATFYVDIPAA